MRCPNCSASNRDEAADCYACRSVLPPAPGIPIGTSGVSGPHPSQAAPLQQTKGRLPPYIPNYLAFAIISTLFCCMPLGIVGIVYAVQVTAKLQTGDITGL